MVGAARVDQRDPMPVAGTSLRSRPDSWPSFRGSRFQPLAGVLEDLELVTAGHPRGSRRAKGRVVL